MYHCILVIRTWACIASCFCLQFVSTHISFCSILIALWTQGGSPNSAWFLVENGNHSNQNKKEIVSRCLVPSTDTKDSMNRAFYLLFFWEKPTLHNKWMASHSKLVNQPTITVDTDHLGDLCTRPTFLLIVWDALFQSYYSPVVARRLFTWNGFNEMRAVPSSPCWFIGDATFS